MYLFNLKEEVLHCTKCELSKTRKNVIFGEGNLNAQIMIIGEAPGRDEDIQGHPFVGQSGKLLDKILEACGFDRIEHIYITNIIKCRPPGNRTPSLEEVRQCKPYLLQQIELIHPEIMILLGAIALKSLVDPNLKITRVRGEWIDWNNYFVIPIYHPSALLRNPALKHNTWEDFKKVVIKYRELVDPQHYSAYL